MKVLLFLVVMVAMMAMLMAQEDAPEIVECSHGQSVLCFLKCIFQGKIPESCNVVNGTVNCLCKDLIAAKPE